MGKRYFTSVPRILHASPQYVLSGSPVPIGAACRAFGEVCPEKLRVVLDDKHSFVMLPYDRYDRKGVSYQLYCAEIPPSYVTGDKIRYRIEQEDGKEQTEVFECDVLSPDSVGVPPLAISEFFVRTRSKGRFPYIELFNPTNKSVDLFDFEILVFPETAAYDGAIDKQPSARLPLADAPGVSILDGASFGAVWPLTPAYFEDEPICTVDEIIEGVNGLYLYEKAPIDRAIVNGFTVDYTEIDEKNGKRVLKIGVCALPEKFTPTTLVLVPREMDADAGVFTLVYNDVFASWDTPVLRSSEWGFDVREPRRAVRYSHASPITPGYPSVWQSANVDPTASLPVILPLSPLCESYHGEYDCEIEFAVVPTEPHRDVCGTFVYVLLDDGQQIKLEAVETNEGTRKATLPEEIFENLDTLSYYITASDGTRDVALCKSKNLSVPVYDNRGPRITKMLPTRGYAYDGRKDTTVRVEFCDKSGLRLSECYIIVDGIDVTRKASWTEKSFEYIPKKPFDVGQHLLQFCLKDSLGNKTTRKIEFSVSDMAHPSIYFGEVHSHTSESDGTGFCENALTYARDNGADFFSVTDHSHYITPEQYRRQKRIADYHNVPGAFAALYGWEMTWNNSCGYWGHINILGAKQIINNMNNITLPELYRWFATESDAVGMFNHPGVAWGDFEEYAYHTVTADSTMALAEIKGANYDREYALMLSKGWHVAPTYNEDNHRPFWTTASPYITGVIAPALTRENIMDAFRERRAYSTADPTMKIYYSINGEWMGARLQNPDELSVEINISTENDIGIGKLEIVAEDNIVVLQKNVGARKSFGYKITLPPEFDYYYLRITNEGQYSVTAPIWIEKRSKIKLSQMRRCASQSSSESTAVTVKLENPTDSTMSEVKADYYLASPDGFVLSDAVPYASVCVGKLKGGRSIEITRQMPEITKLRRVAVVVSAIYEKKTVKSTSFIYIPPINIVEILPKSEPVVDKNGVLIDNPFPFVVLWNDTAKDIDLSGGKLALWTKTGKAPSDDRTFATDGIVIKRRSSVVIWCKDSSSALDCDDFNARYKTERVLGEDLFICERKILSTSSAGRRLDLVLGGEVVSRANWNIGINKNKAAPVGRSYKYRYTSKMTPTCELYAIGVPNVGVLDTRQMTSQIEVLPTRREIKSAKKQAKTDARRQNRRMNLSVTKNEGIAIAASAAVAAATVAASIASLITGVVSARKAKKAPTLSDKEEK